MSYKRFFAMIITSTVVMFVLMYSTVYTLDHVWWSQTKFWMAIYMGAAMAVRPINFRLLRRFGPSMWRASPLDTENDFRRVRGNGPRPRER